MSNAFNLAALKKKLNKEHGKGTIGRAGLIRSIPRLSTGSIAFDRALGGGLPVGRTIIFCGEESSGKTTSLLRTIGISQKLCSNCFRPAKDLHVEEFEDEESGEVFYDAVAHCDCVSKGLHIPFQKYGENDKDFAKRVKAYETNSFAEFKVAMFEPEGTYDIEWSERLGVDNDRLLYVQADTTEEIGDIYDSVMRTGEVHLFALDSIAAMTPACEVEQSLEDSRPGKQAILVNTFIRKVTTSTAYVKKVFGVMPTQIWINQYREKIGGSSFGDNRFMPGGKGQKFAASVIVDFWTSKWEKETQDSDLREEDRSEVGTKVRVNFKTKKNKTAPAKQRGSYGMFVAGENASQIDEFKYVVGMASKMGLYREEGTGSKKRWYVGNEEYSRKKDAMDRLEEPKTFEKLRNRVLKELMSATA